MSIADAALPEFSPTMRGYDRRQVMDYLQRLREYAAELETRLQLVEAERADAQARLARVTAEVTHAGAGPDLAARLRPVLGVPPPGPAPAPPQPTPRPAPPSPGSRNLPDPAPTPAAQVVTAPTARSELDPDTLVLLLRARDSLQAAIDASTA